MAASDRTEAPTPHRRQRARSEGKIARTSMATAVGSIAGAMGMLAIGGAWLFGWLVQNIARPPAAVPDQPTIAWGMAVVRTALLTAGAPMLVIVAGAATGAMALGLAQTGGRITPVVLQPQLSRLNPIAGIGRLVSARVLVEVCRMTALSVIVGLLLWGGVRDVLMRATAGDLATPQGAWHGLRDVAAPLIARLIGVGAVIMVADYAWQWFRLERDLRMTRQELRDDVKETEGDPYWKARRRARARAVARARMMHAVPTAAVVITNPTEVAVALRYDSGMAAPQVVAKGQGHVAARIRAVAWRAGVPIHPEPPLARALYAGAEVGQFIPPRLYRAVAEVLGWIYRTTRTEAAHG